VDTICGHTSLYYKKAFFLFFNGEKRMIKQSLYEQIVIVVGRDELAQMLRAEQGFEIEKIEVQQSEIRFTLERFAHYCKA
jgi:hypothetical protein